MFVGWRQNGLFNRGQMFLIDANYAFDSRIWAQ